MLPWELGNIPDTALVQTLVVEEPWRVLAQNDAKTIADVAEDVHRSSIAKRWATPRPHGVAFEWGDRDWADTHVQTHPRLALDPQNCASVWLTDEAFPAVVSRSWTKLRALRLPGRNRDLMETEHTYSDEYSGRGFGAPGGFGWQAWKAWLLALPDSLEHLSLPCAWGNLTAIDPDTPLRALKTYENYPAVDLLKLSDATAFKRVEAWSDLDASEVEFSSPAYQHLFSQLPSLQKLSFQLAKLSNFDQLIRMLPAGLRDLHLYFQDGDLAAPDWSLLGRLHQLSTLVLILEDDIDMEDYGLDDLRIDLKPPTTWLPADCNVLVSSVYDMPSTLWSFGVLPDLLAHVFTPALPEVWHMHPDSKLRVGMEWVDCNSRANAS